MLGLVAHPGRHGAVVDVGVGRTVDVQHAQQPAFGARQGVIDQRVVSRHFDLEPVITAPPGGTDTVWMPTRKADAASSSLSSFANRQPMVPTRASGGGGQNPTVDRLFIAGAQPRESHRGLSAHLTANLFFIKEFTPQSRFVKIDSLLFNLSPARWNPLA